MSFICSVCQAKNRLKLNFPSGPKSILYLFQFGLIKVNLNHQLQHIPEEIRVDRGTNLEISQQNWSFTDGPVVDDFFFREKIRQPHCEQE